MAVRNLSAIQAHGNQVRAIAVNKATIRKERIENLENKIKNQKQDIIDALDTFEALRKNGVDCDYLSTFRPHNVHRTYYGEEHVIIISGSYKQETYRQNRSDDYSIVYIPNANRFKYEICFGWGGFGGWRSTSDDEYFFTLLEEMASQVESWCNAIFEKAENL